MTRIVTDVAIIETNVDVVVKKLNKYVKHLKTSVLKDAFKLGMDYIGSVSATKFWIQTSAREGEHITASVSDKLTQRTGRLLGSVVGAFRFSQVRLPSSVAKFKSGEFSSSREGFEGGKTESIREVEVTASGITARMGSEVEYAAVHEYGYPAGNIPQRAYLTPAIEESKGALGDIIKEAVEATYKESHI